MTHFGAAPWTRAFTAVEIPTAATTSGRATAVLPVPPQGSPPPVGSPLTARIPSPAAVAPHQSRDQRGGPSQGVHATVTRHTLSVLVENKPGVLARVSSLFSRRGFNIHSLAVGPTENPDVSRMTIVVAVEGLPLEQVTKQLNKLINVLKIVELPPAQAVQRELLLIKLRSDATSRPQIVSIVEMFRARIIDITPEAVTVEATGTSDKLDALIKMLEPFGVRELVQSGMVALGRGPRSITSSTSRAD
jgi:acetolactate synthase-1/3 small subunit